MCRNSSIPVIPHIERVLYLDEDSEIYKSAIPMELIMEAGPRGRYGNAHTHHVSSMSVDSDHSFLTADDLRINLWHHEVTNESFNIVGIKTNMEESTKVTIIVKAYTMAGKLEEETDPVPNSLIQWKLVSTALMTIGRCLFYRNSRNDCGIGSEEDDRLEKKRMDGTVTAATVLYSSLLWECKPIIADSLEPKRYSPNTGCTNFALMDHLS
ncbi:hypothetical protein ANCCEY_08508 [Ancylostoma ceylanicum]|uniref:Serine/threonine-protein phosphatase 2A 55 kDa regulatory subunit B n=1 Tax=Ancylostoma ceylanicum TaxID=53326 RepID=A0A0D6LQW6_9BILA|nr:hypothetical protein ANCCEY_08508 [Ancylostoma ceylanicum]